MKVMLFWALLLLWLWPLAPLAALLIDLAYWMVTARGCTSLPWSADGVVRVIALRLLWLGLLMWPTFALMDAIK